MDKSDDQGGQRRDEYLTLVDADAARCLLPEADTYRIAGEAGGAMIEHLVAAHGGRLYRIWMGLTDLVEIGDDPTAAAAPSLTRQFAREWLELRQQADSDLAPFLERWDVLLGETLAAGCRLVGWLKPQTG
jgi:hypothetical protein